MNKVTPISKRQNALIVGGLLGDSHMQKTSAATGKCRLRFSQNAKQKNYLEWKYEVLKKYFCKTTSGIKADTRDRKTGIYLSYTFYTEYMDEFRSIHAKWYIPKIQISKKGVIKTSFVKTVPSDLNKIFTDPLALAVWYLDDGTKRTDTESCRLATQSFTKEENEIIRDCLLPSSKFRYSFGDRRLGL
jgi:hypothetical protein